MLPPIPYLKEALLGVSIVLVIALGVQTTRLKICKSNLQSAQNKIETLELQVAHAGQQVLTLRDAIDRANEAIRDRERLASQAEGAQRKIDELAQRLARAENDLMEEVRRSDRLRARTEEMGLCETYEWVLRVLSGEQP